MKRSIVLIVMFCSHFLFGQTKEFILVDDTTNEPIDLVQISYPALEIGSISNADGRIRIPLKEQNILVSHINYIEQTFEYDVFKKKDTLFLTPKTNQLDEIIVYNIDLKAKITNILKNSYLNQYSTEKSINKSTYNETFRVNDSLVRLFQVQLDWWSKEALFKGNKPIEDQNKIVLETVDYSKLKKIDSEFVNGASVDNKDFFKFLHLNFLLSIFKELATDIEIKSVEKDEKSINIHFDATLIQNGEKMYDFKNSLMVFDVEYKSINYLKLNMIYDSSLIDDVSKKSKIPYQRKTTKNTVELSFKKLKNNKLSLNYFIFEIEGIIKNKDFTNTISSKQSLFILEHKIGEKIKKSNIDFEEPFYKNLPSNLKVSDVKILLTNEEKEFLQKNN
jgi:hypothetical protein